MRIKVHSGDGHLCWEGTPEMFAGLEPFTCPDLDCNEPYPTRLDIEEAATKVSDLPPEKTGDEEATKNHELWTTLALCLGFNELAKLGKTLGDKVYARLFRDKYVENLIALGGNGGVSPFADAKSIVEIEMPAPMPWLRFRATDIELMRTAVAEHDAAMVTGGGAT